MVLCADLSIDSNVFWTSTPREFNGLMRGSYQRIEREASLVMPLIKSKSKIKLSQLTGFELHKLNITNDVTDGLDEDEAREAVKNEREELEAEYQAMLRGEAPQ